MLSCKNRRTGGRSVGGGEPEHSSAVIASNYDLLREILFRLPVKSLLRFKSVSKRWLSLITDPSFAHNHSLRNRPSVSGFFLRKFSPNPDYDFASLDEIATTAPFRSLTFVDDPNGIQIKQSCNGLLCCSSFRGGESECIYYIYNPATNHYTTLPQPGGGRDTVCSVTLAFDPFKSPHYKAICVRWTDMSYGDCQIEIYSSETGSWRLSGGAFYASNDDDQFIYPGVFWNGAVHWISSRESSLYFDLDQEFLQTMPMPPIAEGWEQRRIRYFGESRGHMYLIEIYRTPGTRFDVFEMERDYSGWFVKYRVDLDGVTIAYPEMIRTYLEVEYLNRYAFSVLYLVQGEEEESSMLVVHIPDMVISYNLTDKTFKMLYDLSPPGPRRADHSPKLGLFDAFPYFETLSCV